MIDKETRKKFDLPIKKEILYFPMNSKKPIKVVNINVEKNFSSWYVLKIDLENGDSVKIHSDFLKEMQKANYSRDSFASVNSYESE